MRDQEQSKGKLPGAQQDRPSVDPRVAARVEESALSGLTPRERESSNLYIDPWVVPPDVALGPVFQPVRVSRPSVLVFADDHPVANFAHPCRYWLYDARTGEPTQRLNGRFPPYPFYGLQVMRSFHQPIAPREPEKTARPQLARALRSLSRACELPPTTAPSQGRRFAILFAGAADQNHLNDLELSYRMLLDVHAFEPEHVFVLFHDGTRGVNGGPFVESGQPGTPRKWPGDGSDFRIALTAEGSKAAFRAVLRQLVEDFELAPEDRLFIHTEGHGGRDELAPEEEAFLYTYPASTVDPQQYFAWEMADDLAVLPPHRSLLVLMNQCYSGGFRTPLRAASTAAATAIACAAQADALAHATLPDLRWNDFSLDWMEAQMRRHLNQTAVNSDTDGDGAVAAREAYTYAETHTQGLDTPNYAIKPDPAGHQISLGS